MPMPDYLLATQLHIARGYYGIKVAEEPLGSNLGYWVDIFQEDAGLKGGDAWCMAFIYHCHELACTMQRINNPLLKATGWCKGQWLWALKSTRLSVMPRDAIKDGWEIPRGAVWVRFDEDGTGHTGFVIDHNPKGKTFKSLEGNASDRVKIKEYIISNINNFKGVIY